MSKQENTPTKAQALEAMQALLKTKEEKVRYDGKPRDRFYCGRTAPIRFRTFYCQALGLAEDIADTAIYNALEVEGLVAVGVPRETALLMSRQEY